MSAEIRATRRVGYILNAFPVVSETFILNELRAMRSGIVEVAILPLSDRCAAVRHGGLEELDFPIRYPPGRNLVGIAALAAAHVRLAWRHSRRYLHVVQREIVAAFWRALIAPTQANRRSATKRLRRFLMAASIADAARGLNVVHLHAHYAREPLAVAGLVRRLTGLPYSFAAHAKDLYTSSSDVLARHLEHAKFAVACHDHGRCHLEGLAAPSNRDKVCLIHHGIDLRLFRTRNVHSGAVSISASNGQPAESRSLCAPSDRRDAPLILAVGRLTPKKGFEKLINACALLRHAGRMFRCVIVGEGKQEQVLRQLIMEAGLADIVRLQPFLSQEELVERYQQATVLAAPCVVTNDGNRDGIPNVVLEAMACGVPVVSTPVGGIPELIVDGRNGLLVSEGDAQALAGALERVIVDPDLRQQLGQAAAATAATMDYLRANAPLVRKFREITTPALERILQQVADQTWQDGGLCHKARKVLGVRPRKLEEVEQGIAAAIAPGLAANAWRPDFADLARRRLWDEAFKARRLTRMAPPEAWCGKRVADVGCGRGGLTVALAAWGARVVGLDLRERNCRVTRLRGQRYGLTISTISAPAESLPFDAAAFDHVFCLDVLEHVQDPIAVLKEIHRVLGPSGTCTITVINRLAHVDPHYHLWGVNFIPRFVANRYIRLRGRTKSSWRDLQTLDEMHYFTYQAFIRLVRRIGFAVIDPEWPTARSRWNWIRGLARRSSLGFNTATLVLVKS